MSSRWLIRCWSKILSVFNLLRLIKNVKDLPLAVAPTSSVWIGIQEELVVIWLGLCDQLDIVLSAAEVAFLFWPLWSSHVSWNCMVSTVARLWAEQPRNLCLILNDGKRFCFLLQSIQTDGGTHPAFSSVYTWGSSFWVGGINQPGHEADYASPSGTEVETECSSTSTPICFVWCAQGQFYLYLNVFRPQKHWQCTETSRGAY